MTHKQIAIGSHYTARVGRNLTAVRVLAIREQYNGRQMRTVYDVENTLTGRRVTFRSPQRFRARVELAKKTEAVRC